MDHPRQEVPTETVGEAKTDGPTWYCFRCAKFSAAETCRKCQAAGLEEWLSDCSEFEGSSEDEASVFHQSGSEEIGKVVLDATACSAELLCDEPPTHTRFKWGDQVRIVGMTAGKELNGTRGSVTQTLKNGRIELATRPYSELKAILPENLELVAVVWNAEATTFVPNVATPVAERNEEKEDDRDRKERKERAKALLKHTRRCAVPRPGDPGFAKWCEGASASQATNEELQAMINRHFS